MADAPKADHRGGFGGRGRGRGREDKKQWMPVTKLGRLVKEGKILSLGEIYTFSLPIKEAEIIEHFLGSALKDEVLKVKPVQKQTRAGQRTRFKATVVVGDNAGHIGLGIKASKEVAMAIRAAITLAKLSVIPIRRGYWGTKLGEPHTVPCKVHAKCGSVHMRLIPAPRGTGIVAAPVPKKILAYAGYADVYTSAKGCTATLGNFAKATFQAIAETSSYLSPDQWKEEALTKTPIELHTDHLQKNHTLASIKEAQKNIAH